MNRGDYHPKEYGWFDSVFDNIKISIGDYVIYQWWNPFEKSKKVVDINIYRRYGDARLYDHYYDVAVTMVADNGTECTFYYKNGEKLPNKAL